ncbi:MAG TPA: phosphoglucosamine mutase [Hyphomicrobiales bacterium]|nr:phosphoglucosamine mutase [Hyphomicrobiales bacterium]
MKKYFGTDGIRGAVGTYPITPDFMLKLGWAAGRVFGKQGKCKVLIGKDTRISGYMFEAALEAGLASAGVDINMLGPMPTPAVAYLTHTFGAEAGIVISASHNPHQDNGIKFFSSQGTKLADEVEEAIEAVMEQDFTVVPSDSIGKVSRIVDAAGRYIEFCKSTYKYPKKLSGLKVVLDCAHGATYHVAPSVISELGAQVSVIGNQPNGLNINAECGSTHTARLKQEVLRVQADIGIAFDGDGDRVIMVDHTGAEVDGDELLYIIVRHKRERNLLGGGVVGTQMSNFGLELALQSAGIPFARSRVGDRYVMAELLNRGWLFGGESSGHLICLDATSTGDGIVSALQVLAALQASGRSLHELKQGMAKFPQKMINVKVADRDKLGGNPTIDGAVAEAEAQLAGKGRVLLRPSGTEPVIRVMVEGQDAVLVGQMAQQLSEVVAAACA